VEKIPKNFDKLSPADKAVIRFKENSKERFDLWRSIINDSNLNEQNKKRFLNIFNLDTDLIQGIGFEGYFRRIKGELYTAVVYSYETDEALALYKNLEADIDQFMEELYAE